ncbi:transaldolase [Plebeiibacterium marinum]|uniref:Transaldolase n=1 Tax=Plebeiibacterium marinum TaxID=2992111 RepID=A0AAE3SKD7_9BACT|nr:transaldolase [Plebeiobacterium marinum]MCW3805390.1 transaldolase [Plebeiobacterium marinum]
MNALEQLKELTKVVADTGDFESMKSFRPLDATTNPSLILKAVQNPQYVHLIDEAVDYAKKKEASVGCRLSLALDKVAVNFGKEILKVVPGRVSTEVDSRLSFDRERTIDRARNLIALYEESGIPRNKILIKIASTWEGIKAAELLAKEEIRCNLTLMFNMVQAVACAEAGVQLISPFVGRIYDWYKKDRGVDHIDPVDDPGVLSVVDIYNYYKKFGYETEVMGASFRNIGQVIELAGCDLLTISPVLLSELETKDISVALRLSPEKAKDLNIEKIEVTESTFRWHMNEDPMATEKLAEGIRSFARDIVTLEELLKVRMG